jgi:hypothetical protein
MMSGRGVRTVRDFQSIGYTLVPHCSHDVICTHFRLLPIDYLAEHLGWNFDLYAGRSELRRRLRCTQCGWNWPVVHVATQQDRAGASGAAHAHEDSMPYAEALRRELERRAELRARGETMFDLGFRRRGH